MVGALVQFDQFSEPTAIASHSLWDRGWMAGPVTTLQFAPGLSLDAKAAWGAAESGTAYLPTGPLADRRLLEAKLANTQTFGGWRFTPSVNLNYLEEMQRLTEAASRVVGSGRVDVRPELGYRFNMAAGTYIEPKAALSSFWDIDSLSLKPAGHEDVRIKAEAGLTIGTADGAKVQASGGLEEGAAGAADTWSGRFRFNVPLRSSY
jgi:hypothetical protein